jgi:hypothetical protein
MPFTKDEIVKKITSELDECLESQNAEVYDYSDKIVDVDTKNKTITIKFDYNVVEEDEYVGLSFY